MLEYSGNHLAMAPSVKVQNQQHDQGYRCSRPFQEVSDPLGILYMVARGFVTVENVPLKPDPPFMFKFSHAAPLDIAPTQHPWSRMKYPSQNHRGLETLSQSSAVKMGLLNKSTGTSSAKLVAPSSREPSAASKVNWSRPSRRKTSTST